MKLIKTSIFSIIIISFIFLFASCKEDNEIIKYEQIAFEQIELKKENEETFILVIKNNESEEHDNYKAVIEQYSKDKDKYLYYVEYDTLILNEKEIIKNDINKVLSIDEIDKFKIITINYNKGKVINVANGLLKYEELKYFDENNLIKINSNQISEKINNCSECIFVLIREIDQEYEQMLNLYGSDLSKIIYYITDIDLQENNPLYNQIKSMPSYESEEIDEVITIKVRENKIVNAINGKLTYKNLINFDSQLVKITLNELNDKMSNNKNFTFVIEANYCGYCQLFMPVVEKYALDKNEIIYYLDVGDNNDLTLTSESIENLRKKVFSANEKYTSFYTPTTVVVEEGVIKSAMIGYISYDKLNDFLK